VACRHRNDTRAPLLCARNADLAGAQRVDTITSRLCHRQLRYASVPSEQQGSKFENTNLVEFGMTAAEDGAAVHGRLMRAMHLSSQVLAKSAAQLRQTHRNAKQDEGGEDHETLYVSTRQGGKPAKHATGRDHVKVCKPSLVLVQCAATAAQPAQLHLRARPSNCAVAPGHSARCIVWNDQLRPQPVL
jgi:hypothetical protein